MEKRRFPIHDATECHACGVTSETLSRPSEGDRAQAQRSIKYDGLKSSRFQTHLDCSSFRIKIESNSVSSVVRDKEESVCACEYVRTAKGVLRSRCTEAPLPVETSSIQGRARWSWLMVLDSKARTKT